METQLSRIERHLDIVAGRLHNQVERLAAIESDLRHHIKRSDSLEAQVDELRKFMWKVLGALCVVGPLLTAAIQWAMKSL